MDVERRPVEVRFSCRRCQLAWGENFDLVRLTDYDGDVLETYSRGGVPVPPPALGRRCPRCGSLAVDWTDATYLPRGGADKPAAPLVNSRWTTPEPAMYRRGFFTRAAHQHEPRTRRFP
ncbi:hypothetical protein I6A84_42510 [Frankia sp. CNm7]|uniref:Uncharacterized protein n=1 Tax=Frankia nepalensis TaxID=1836974 RepID=A0A937UU86_9ACTN|nr:hypothetical protein [Frankia nepalensis]MBL7498498.1 hypothetical protein [Frankia nepalensis]MBL7509648.1 hypothetical protein [Frankia nepalensis]MBL7524538.1 hypothetical protein [Frankia nepalensis]MBL7630856.1 hypothetical protein [Frankia nepalensis]